MFILTKKKGPAGLLVSTSDRSHLVTKLVDNQILLSKFILNVDTLYCVFLHHALLNPEYQKL